jgi:indolepyruvate ferredoxin oxidoreductase
MTTVNDRPPRLEDRYEFDQGQVYLSGLQALARIPLDQHRLDRRNGLNTATLISGYEGSPLAGLDLELSRRSEILDEHQVVFIPAVNEELGANAVQGSQLVSTAEEQKYDGVVGIWYGKAPGLDRATDALRHGNLGGASPSGGVLALTGDDSIAKSSTVPSSSESAMAEIGMTVLSPSDPQDVLDLGLHGIALSRFCGLWTGLKLATNVVDGAATTRVDSGRVAPMLPDNIIDGVPFVHQVSAQFLQPNLGVLERTATTTRLELARRYAYANQLNIVSGDSSAKIGIVAAGATYRDVMQALRNMGISEETLADSGVRVLKLGMVAPIEPRIVGEFAAGLHEILVVEEKRAFIELTLKDVLYGQADAPAVFGKRGPDGRELLRADADLPPELIARAIAPRLIARGASAVVSEWMESSARSRARRDLLPILNRSPYFCSGCPHNRSTAVPDGSLVGAGIGCHTLAVLMPEDQVGTIIGMSQMGGEGAPWIGMQPFVGHDHLFQNLGDGTFHHSGILAIRAAIAAGSHITYKLLYNDAVAMTGGQAAVGRMTVPSITRELLAEGVTKIIVTTEDLKRYKGVRLPRGVELRHRDRLVETQAELAATSGVTVLIHDQECATELRRKRKRKMVAEPVERAFINERVCEGCGDCGVKSNCLSVQPVETEFGRKTKIDQATCNKDYSCLDGDCPSFISVVPGKKMSAKRSAAGLTAEELPDPVMKVTASDFNLRITGVGGTGIVTTAQIISTAASIAGLEVCSLDQMGMAQKGGAVVSDIRISDVPEPGANKVGEGQCDLYLGCDILVAAHTGNLAVATPERTIAVVSTGKVPTGAMVADTTVAFPDAHETMARINERSRAGDNVFADVREITTALFGSDQNANIFMLGMAVQAGALPVNSVDIEKAISLNAVAVERNVQAFRRGRQQVADPAAAAAYRRSLGVPAKAARASADVAGLVQAAAGSPLRELVLNRVEELRRFQDIPYARRYAVAVERVRQREADARGDDGVVSLEYARQLYKLMAYKDEYEVARLSIDPRLGRELREQFGTDVKYGFRLHPPILRALGMKRKIRLGQWFRPVFVLLYALRGLRGTPFDVFGRGEIRRTERAIIGEYVSAVEGAVFAERPDWEAAERIAALPDGVRGYEQVKMASVEVFRRSLTEVTGVAAPKR